MQKRISVYFKDKIAVYDTRFKLEGVRNVYECCRDDADYVLTEIETILNGGSSSLNHKLETYYFLTVYGLSCTKCRAKVKDALMELDSILDVEFSGENITIYVNREIDVNQIKETIDSLGSYWVEEII